ncbi:MAG: hypothetical protein BJ554DRAFT_6288 [Olpidium bornovanus]|uniref:Uncharacterized protein n=1 Tax=Olpidium bornovanus TaxID=278681 RepID=A0A8H7ZY32_9FUNG|nr:MAG: hypothetical protein BJ554DRAFT_6288 [Olpidium bornovanus]
MDTVLADPRRPPARVADPASGQERPVLGARHGRRPLVPDLPGVRQPPEVDVDRALGGYVQRVLRRRKRKIRREEIISIPPANPKAKIKKKIKKRKGRLVRIARATWPGRAFSGKNSGNQLNIPGECVLGSVPKWDEKTKPFLDRRKQNFQKGGVGKGETTGPNVLETEIAQRFRVKKNGERTYSTSRLGRAQIQNTRPGREASRRGPRRTLRCLSDIAIGTSRREELYLEEVGPRPRPSLGGGRPNTSGARRRGQRF